MTSSGDKEFDARALGAVRKTKQLSAVNHLSDEEFEQVRVLNLVFRPQALKN
jgi:outer membrane biosynthesis protein TonB